MIHTKKLERLLLKYRKANLARLSAYKKRSVALGGKWNAEAGVRIVAEPITPEVVAELQANIDRARLKRIEVSRVLCAYCKKKGFHIEWGTSNQVVKVSTSTERKLRRHSNLSNAFMGVLSSLKLTPTKESYYF